MISCDPYGAAALAQLEINRLTARLTVICLDLHRELGPGAPRRLYEEALVFELDSAGIGSRRRVEWLVRHRGVRLNTRVAVDLLADETVALNLLYGAAKHLRAVALRLQGISLSPEDTLCAPIEPERLHELVNAKPV